MTAARTTENFEPAVSRSGEESRRVQLGEKLAENKWVERSAKLGYAARGLLYIISGLTMALAAANLREPVRGMRQSLDLLMEIPFGRIAVGLVAVGLFGYILRRIVQAMVPPQEGTPPRPIMRFGRRLGYVWSGLIHVGVALTALQFFLWSTAYGAWRFTANRPFTPNDGWLLIIIGLGTIGYAGFEFYMAAKRRFTIDLLLERMSRRVENFILWCGIVGYTGRGIAFFSVGLLFVYVGWNVDNFRFGYILETFQALPFTFWILVIAAAGLIAYGLYSLLAAWYLRFIATW
jgi:uncharacterized membrane protein YidH (DUF202 family)